MPNGNAIEVVTRIRDLASGGVLKLNRNLEETGKAARVGERGLQRIQAGGISATRQISALAATTRFAAVGLVAEMDPALGIVITRMASLSSVANITGTVLRGVLVAGGITLAIGAISTWLQHTNEQIEAQLKLNRAITQFDVKGLVGQMNEARDAIDAITARSQTLLGAALQQVKDTFSILVTGSTNVENLQRRIEDAAIAFNALRPREHAQEMRKLNLQFLQGAAAVLQHQLALAEGPEAIAQATRAVEANFLRQQELQLAILNEQQSLAVRAAVGQQQGQAEILRIEESFGKQRELASQRTADAIVKLNEDANRRIIEGTTRLGQIGAEALGRFAEVSDGLSRRFAVTAEQIENARRAAVNFVDSSIDAIERVRASGTTFAAMSNQVVTESNRLEEAGAGLGQTFERDVAGLFRRMATGDLPKFQDIWTSVFDTIVSVTADAAARILLFGGQGFALPTGAAGDTGGLAGFLGTIGSLLAGSFQEGGPVTRTGLALVHAGERVLSRDEAAGGGMGGGVTVINLSDPNQLSGIVAAEVSKGREVVVNDVVSGMRSNRGIRRGIQRFR